MLLNEPYTINPDESVELLAIPISEFYKQKHNKPGNYCVIKKSNGRNNIKLLDIQIDYYGCHYHEDNSEFFKDFDITHVITKKPTNYIPDSMVYNGVTYKNGETVLVKDHRIATSQYTIGFFIGRISIEKAENDYHIFVVIDHNKFSISEWTTIHKITINS